ncbi:HlyD family secretion protein [Magnetospirillum molischianum]|uniref:Putative HlyD family secretion protein (Modular protein) n=1 Tax=Magnetospirillum molischianum DSM 120 TaxID=1150626 RepID=H8FQ32_MAGML|nr:HlyD family efflux transporter periplasmic adaptor subunit [Magnetospirillum molischianum]CCG40470.1 putative HlyD family secretion protein (modular protein) [Magnetospirillum molischianum DSM 120]
MTKTDASPDTKTEIRTETRTETNPDGKIVTKTEIRTETKTETAPDSKVETRTETHTEIKPDATIETKVETRTETRGTAEAKAEAKSAPPPDAHPEEKKPETEPKPAPTPTPKPEDAKPAPKPTRTKWIVGGVILVVAVGLGLLVWDLLKPKQLGPGFASGNGRIEAVEIDVAAKLPGRLADILVKEGEVVERGQVVARMDTQGLDAQMAEAAADLARAESAIVTAESQVTQRRSERAAALAVVAQRKAELTVAGKRLARSRTLSSEGAAAVQEYDDDLASQQGSAAAVAAAQAQVAAADAAIVTARAQVVGARSSADAARATMTRIQTDIEDCALKSPRDGRVQYRVAQAAEVIAAGGKVLNLVDLSDVYMTFFLPDAAVGKVALGSEVRLVLDAAPQWVIPASVSFVADVAQFTPKSVETASERQKLMFRVRARLDPELLRKFSRDVKTGLPGMAYVRLDAAQDWPARLALHVPQ